MKVDDSLNLGNVTYDYIIGVFNRLGGNWLKWQNNKYPKYYELTSVKLLDVSQDDWNTKVFGDTQ